nr:hypothetical protein [Tanacetum cinerariifolium]
MGDHNRFSQKSKEHLTQQISKSVFVTNFPDHISAHDLWTICKQYGSIVYVYVPLKRSKSGKRFAFVRFIKVVNLERLIENLCTIWIGSFHLYANMVCFQRESKPKSNFHVNVNPLGVPPGNPSFFMNSGSHNGSFAVILKGGPQKTSYHEHSLPALVLDDSCLKDHDLSLSLMGKVKEVFTILNLYFILSKEGFQSVKLKYLGASGSLLNWTPLIQIVWISIEGLPINSWTTNTFSRIASKWGDLVIWEESEDMTSSCKHLCLKMKVNVIIKECYKIIIKGKVHWLRAKELDAWIPKFFFEEECNSSDKDASNDFDKVRTPADMEFDNSTTESDVERVLESSFMKEYNFVYEEAQKPNCEDTSQFSDPFKIYDLLQKKKVTIPQTNASDPLYPPGFTPKGNHNEGESVIALTVHV